jgi:Uma2 family endonuclease
MTKVLLEAGLLDLSQFPDDMTEEEFLAFSRQHEPFRMEREADGTVIIMSPVGSDSGYFENRINVQLELWNRSQPVPGLTFSSSTGFRLPNGAIRSPDASWMALESWQSVPEAERKGFLPRCPDFVVELRSPGDPLPSLQAKMAEWMANGARLAWLIDPVEEKVFIYRPEQEVEPVADFSAVLSGEDVLPGFAFDLKLLRLPE